MDKPLLTTKELIEHFELDVLYKGNIKNQISVPGLYRTGLELAEKQVFQKLSGVVMWSKLESKYLNTLDEQNRIKAIKNVIGMGPPVILLTKSFEHDSLVIKLAKGQTTTIIKNDMTSSESYLTIATYINEKLAKFNTLHGTLISVYGIGVLLQGESGVGKSEIAIELIKNGHIFVADDAVDVNNFAGRLVGRPNAIANNFIEVRGLGILNITKMFGVEKVNTSSSIDAIVELIKVEKISDEEFERIGNVRHYINVEKCKIPYYKLPVSPGRKMSDLVESVVVDLKLKISGYNSADDYISNYKKIIRKESKK